MLATLLVLLTLHPPTQNVELKTATRHSMKYYVSLPVGWTANKRWPVVVALPDAERDFEGSANRFANARKNRPYIIVVPMVVTNGGQKYRSVPTYKYGQAIWDEIDRVGEYTFDLQGIEAVVSDVRSSYCAEPKFYTCAFEAGCHTLFALTFRHPDWLNASAPNSPNYLGRGMDEDAFSKSPTREVLPIHEIHGSEDPFCDPGKPFYNQWRTAESVARSHGFKNITTQVVPGKNHVWLIDETLNYFDSLRH